MSLTPKTPIPEGAIRYNTDSNKMEVWIGDKWMQVAVSSPNLGSSEAGVRGLFMQKFDDSSNNGTIDYITISTAGNAIDYGDLGNSIQFYGGACSSHKRWVQFGGYNGSNHTNQIQFGEFAITGNGTDFGDLTENTQYSPSGVGSRTRGVRMGGSVDPSGGAQNTMDFWTYESTGNAVDFGDLVAAKRFSYSANSPTRGILSGGDFTNPSVGTEINQFITIASTGNAQTFGDLSSILQYGGGNGACSNPVKGMFGSGSKKGTSVQTDTEAIIIATTGESSKFGDLTVGRYYSGSTASATRGVWGGGYTGSAYINTIDYISIATGGNAVDFGDRTVAGSYVSACSNGHGGL